MKELLAAIKVGNRIAFDRLVAKGAKATIKFRAVPMNAFAFKAFGRHCSRRGQMQTDYESGEVITAVFDCIGTQFDPDSLMAVTFTGTKVSKMEVLRTLYVPSPPPMPNKPNG